MHHLFKSIGLRKHHLFILTVAALAWMTIVVCSGYGWNPFDIPWDFSNPGAFGDSFGPFSAAMASIAAIGAIAAFQSQAKEIIRLKERQEEQDEIAMSDRARTISREFDADKRLERTSFENTFFKLLEAFRSLVSSIDIKKMSGGTASAHDAFEEILNRFDVNLSYYHNDFDRTWQDLSEKYKNDLNHYFRFTYHIVRYAKESSIPDKYFYVRLLRAMLCESEIILLALNCVHGEGREKFKDLVEEYALLHNMSLQARQKFQISLHFSSRAFDRVPTTPVTGKASIR